MTTQTSFRHLFFKPGFHSNAIACVACVNENQRKRLRFLLFSFTQRTQRKRLRLNGNRALGTRQGQAGHFVFDLGDVRSPLVLSTDNSTALRCQ